MSKKVCHISTAHNENDSRILLKECQSLSKAGYDVNLIVTSDKEKELYGTKILPLSENGGRLYRILFKRNEAYKKALELDADIYHFHDPELIGIGKKLKKKGKKVIYDVHEDVPKQVINKTYLGPLVVRKIVSKVFDLNERSSAKKFDAVVGAIDEIADKFQHKNAIAIKNFAVKEVIDKAIPIGREGSEDKLVIAYVGGITEIRGIKELIQATKNFNGKVELWILGAWESEQLFEQCKKLPGYEYCKYFGSLLLKDVYRYTKSADVGMCTLHPVANYKESIPIKVLEYMASGLPIVLSNFQYWKNLFGDVGIYVDPLNIDDIAKGIQRFLDNKELIKDIGQKNRERFIEYFSWDAEEKKLLKLYEDLLK